MTRTTTPVTMTIRQTSRRERPPRLEPALKGGSRGVEGRIAKAEEAPRILGSSGQIIPKSPTPDPKAFPNS